MPVQTTYPGVYIEERPSGVHTIVGVSTSVTAFVGRGGEGTCRQPVRIFSFSDYLRTFGPPLDEVSPMGHAVQHFFANGGSQAVIVRVARRQRGGGVRRRSRRRCPSGTDVLTLTAIGRGEWANRTGSVGLEAEVDRDGDGEPRRPVQPGRHATVTLDPRDQRPRRQARARDHLNLSMSPRHPRYALNVLGGVAARRRERPGRRSRRRSRAPRSGAGAARRPAHDHRGRQDAARLGRLRPAASIVLLFPTETRRRRPRRLAQIVDRDQHRPRRTPGSPPTASLARTTAEDRVQRRRAWTRR